MALAPVYKSRLFGLPNDWGMLVLGDVGEKVNGDVKRDHYAQPQVRRSPEVLVQAPGGFPAGIVWNVGAPLLNSEY